jgi:hypothetical protein
MIFESYTDCLLQAFKSHIRPAEVLKRKKEILDEIAIFHNFSPSSVLYVGFNPAILVDQTKNISVTSISLDARNFLNQNNIKFNYIPEDKLSQFGKKFDSVIALDEYFTFAENDNKQREKVIEICNLATEYVITTCKDYKNQEFKDREFSIPALVRGNNSADIFLEFHDHNSADRNSWQTQVYHINDMSLRTSGPFARRAMFFKQLAKFSHDAGAAGFNVHKNLMYKSLIKKNYEHVISIRFDNGS